MILLGAVIPVVLYVAFIAGALMLNSLATPDTIGGLSFLSPAMLGLLGVLGFVALWTSYFMIGTNLRDTLRDDFNISRIIAYAAPVLTPPLLFLLGLNNFLEAVSFTGSVFLGIEGVAIAIMWRRAFPSNPRRWIAYPLIAIFSLAVVSEVVKLL